MLWMLWLLVPIILLCLYVAVYTCTRRKWKLAFWSLLCCIGCCIYGFGIYAIEASIKNTDSTGFHAAMNTMIVGAVVAFSSFIFYLWTVSAETKAEQAQTRQFEIGGTALDRFFVECVLSGANDFSQVKNKQRAKLFADKYNLTYPNGIETLYQQGLKAHEAVNQRFIQNQMESLREKEKTLFEKLNKYSDLAGRNKRIAMLSDRADELRRNAKNQRDFADALVRSGQQKEGDWAVWGGIADGIAGFGAGVSTAIDIQLQNIQIRAENARRMQEAMPSYLFITNSASINNSNANAIMKEIEQVKLKLVSDVPKEDLMKRISFSHTDVLVSDTGAAMVCTSASVNSDFTIFGDVPAVIDGTIIAKIYEGHTLCGTAQLVLPIYGLGENITLSGICLDGYKSGTKYTVQFMPKDLWAMEK